MQHKIVYLNGEFLPLDQAKISVLDRGFLFGDGVYEVIPAYHKKLFRFDEHLKRFDESLAAVRIPTPLTHEQFASVFNILIEENEGKDQYIYCQITRGAADQRDHAFPKDVAPCVFAMSNVMKTPTPEYYINMKGVQAVTYPDQRWLRCDIKAITLLANILARQHAIDENVHESIFIRDGFATEGAATNLFIVKGKKVITSPKTHLILGGITRDLVIEILRAHNVTVEEKSISLNDLKTANEVWLTSSTKEIMPVTRIDQHLVNKGHIGDLWLKAARWFKTFIQELGRE
jgi:D-alanine transaminase